MKYSTSNPPLVCMQTTSTCYRGTRKMTVKGVLWHSTGSNNPWLKRYVQPSDNASDKTAMLNLLGKNQYGNDWNHIERQAGLNCWIGKLANGTVTTIQTMPWDYRPWGCGSGSKGSCNDGWIQFEICEDSLSDKSYFDKIYQEACEITAYLCKLYNINPKGKINHNGVSVPTILCHWDSYELKLGSGHGDVYHWFNKYGKSMDDVRNDVAKLLGSTSSTSTTTSVDYHAQVVVKNDVLNCRKGPGTSNAVVKTYTNGTILHITKVSDGWGYTGDGWVSLTYTVKIKEEDWIDMTKAEVTNLIQSSVTAGIKNAFPTYNTINEVPSYYRASVQKLINKGTLQGTGGNKLGVSEDLCKIITILDRLGVIS